VSAADTVQTALHSLRGSLQTCQGKPWLHGWGSGWLCSPWAPLPSCVVLPGLSCSPCTPEQQSSWDYPDLTFTSTRAQIPAPGPQGTALLQTIRCAAAKFSHAGGTGLLPSPSRAAALCSQGPTTWFTPPSQQCLLFILTFRLLQLPEAGFGRPQLEHSPARLRSAEPGCDKSMCTEGEGFGSTSTSLPGPVSCSPGSKSKQCFRENRVCQEHDLLLGHLMAGRHQKPDA